MSNLWPRIEPLLARVEKPARYIGMERGRQRRPTGPAGRLAPRLPRHLRDRAPQPGAADPLRDPERTRRRRRRARLRAVGRPGGRAAAPRRAAVLGRHPPPGRRLRRPRLQPLGRARLHERPQLHRPRRRAGAGRAPHPEHPLVVAGGHCAYNPEPMADFVDAFVIGDGEEVVGEITEVVGRGSAPVARPARVSCASSPRSRACTCPPCTTSSTTGRSSGSDARARRRARAGRQAHGGRPRRVALPEAAARAAHRGRARPPQRRDLPRLHAGAGSARPA